MRGFPERRAFHREVEPRKDILKRLEKDCKKLENDPRPVFLCFTCDPYPPKEPSWNITGRALDLFNSYRIKVNLLTKGGARIFVRDTNLFRCHTGIKPWHLGTTVIFVDPMYYEEWEPHAATFEQRKAMLVAAKQLGIKTWVSVEPVIDTDQAIMAICELLPHADMFKIGKINHGGRISAKLAKIEKETNWKAFVVAAHRMLTEPSKGKPFYFKQSLWPYCDEAGVPRWSE